MAEFITGFETAEGVKKYDYNSLANKPEDGTGTIISGNADYAEVGEWSDGNPNSEDRLGYFVAIATVEDNTIKIRKATSEDDVKGVTVRNPAFSGNAAAEKYVSDGVLYPKYSYVGLMGIVSVIDNGTCTVGGRCMPADDGTAIPSTNNMGYGVLERIDENHVLIAVEPGADMIQRIKTQIVELQNRPSGGGGSTELDSEIFKKDVIIPETSLTMTEWGSGSKTAIHSDGKVEIGETYTVIWNGVKYSCVAKDAGGGYDSVILGNGLAFGLPVTDEPFWLRFYNDTELTENVEISTLEYIASATIEVTTPQTINPKYIPDMYYTGDGEMVEILPETEGILDEEMFAFMGTPLSLVEGSPYTVKYNGVDFECVATKIEVGEDVAIGLGDTGAATGEPTGVFPFVILATDMFASMGLACIAMPLDGSTNVTLSILGKGEKIHKIPPKYIKDMYYEEIIKDAELFSTTVSSSSTKISSIGLVAGQTYKVNFNGTNYECVAISLSDTTVGLGDFTSIGGSGNGEPFLYYEVMSDGAGYINILDTAITSAPFTILGDTTVMHKVDKKYLPNELYEAPFLDISGIGYFSHDAHIPFNDETVVQFLRENKDAPRINIRCGLLTDTINYSLLEIDATFVKCYEKTEGNTLISLGFKSCYFDGDKRMTTLLIHIGSKSTFRLEAFYDVIVDNVVNVSDLTFKEGEQSTKSVAGYYNLFVSPIRNHYFKAIDLKIVDESGNEIVTLGETVFNSYWVETVNDTGIYFAGTICQLGTTVYAIAIGVTDIFDATPNLYWRVKTLS